MPLKRNRAIRGIVYLIQVISLTKFLLNSILKKIALITKNIRVRIWRRVRCRDKGRGMAMGMGRDRGRGKGRGRDRGMGRDQ